MRIRVIVLSTLFILSSCASGPKPPPLPQYQSKLPIKTKWSASADHGTGGYYLNLTPQYKDQTVYVSSFDGIVSALDSRDGHKLWEKQLDQKLTSGVGLGRRLIFVGSEEGTVYALSAKSGELTWRHSLSNEILAVPHYAKGHVYVKCEDGWVYALNAKNGKELWSYQEQLPSLILRGSSEPQTQGNRVFVGFANSNVVALAANTGAVLWTYKVAQGLGESPVSRLADIDDAPVVKGNTVYVASYQGYLVALSSTTGRLKWRHKISSFSGLAVDQNQVYVADAQGQVWAFSRQNGDNLWVQKKLSGRELTAPVLTGKNTIILGDRQGYLHWVNRKNGQLIGRYYLGGGFIAQPLVHQSHIFAYTQNGNVYRVQVN